MDWNNFKIIKDKASSFEMLINHLASKYFKKEYNNLTEFVVVNGAGGDGGVECYALLDDGSKIGVQSKWFPDVIKQPQIKQIKGSIDTALQIHPELKKYIICVPRNLGNKRKGTDNPEYNNLHELFALYKQIEIELWDENSISELLTEPYNVGIFNFWFKNEYLPYENFQISFDSQRESWLANRYIPQLFTEGSLSCYIDDFLGFKNKEHNLLMIDNIIQITEELNSLILDLKHYCEKNKRHYNVDLVNEYQTNKLFISKLIDMKNNIISEKKIKDLEWEFKHFYDFKEELRKCFWLDKIHFHLMPIEKKLNSLIEFLDTEFDFIVNYHDHIISRSMLIIGDGGTGKTCAVAAKVEELLKNEYALPILIRGKKFGTNSEWHELISKALLLGDVISHNELINIFENLSIILRKKHPDNGIIPKIVVFVDGCDEVEPYSIWQEMILKANKISCNHSFVKFIFTGRSYAFHGINDEETTKYYITSDGDVSVEKLFDIYLKEYNISMNDNSWLKSFIRTPFALRLFCDVNRNQTIIDSNIKNDNYINLFKKKINSLENNYNILHSDSKIERNLINKYIKLVYDCLYEKKNKDSDIKSKIKDEIGSLDDYDKIMDYLCKEGFIEIHYSIIDPIYDIKDVHYFVGIQPYFDYLMALKWFDDDGNFIDNSSKYNNLGILQIVALNLIENTNQFLCDKVKLYYSFEADCFALSHCSYNAAHKFYNRLYKNMIKSPDMFRTILNSVTINVIKDIDNPIGLKLLDEFLSSFDKPIQRDIYWSVPGNLWAEKGAKVFWENNTYIELLAEKELNYNYSFAEVVVLVWALSNLDNDVRYRVRNTIYNWSLNNKEEFCKIFKKFISVNDNQIRMDLFAIAMSFIYECDSSIGLKLIEIIQEFYGESFYLECDCSIRYFVDGIIRWGINKAYINEEQKENFYKEYNEESIILNDDVILNCECPQDGFNGISYDLSRYVLIDPIYRKFKGYNDNSIENQKIYSFLNTFKELSTREYRLDYFILSYAFNCLIEFGWDKNEIVGDWRSDPIIQGIDSAILRHCWPSTHGSMSRIMSITEKYVWLIKNKLNTLFSSKFNIYDNSNKYSKIYSYIQLDSFPCPAQECKKTKYSDVSDFCKIIDHKFSNPSKIAINEYIDNIPVVKFHEWKSKRIANNNYYLSYLYVDNKNESVGLETLVWASLCLVDKEQIALLKEVSKSKSNSLLREFNEPVNIHCYPNVDCYVTPKELCWNIGIKETSEVIDVEGIKFYPTVVYVSSNDGMNGDEHFYIPSQKIRNILNIKNMNGNLLYDEESEVKAQVVNVGQGWDTNETALYIDKIAIDNYLKENKMILCWFFRQKVSTTGKYEEMHKQQMHENDRVFIVFNDGDEECQIEIKFDEKIEVSNNLNEEYLKLIEELGYDSD